MFSLFVIGFASAHASPLIVKPYDDLDSISQSLLKEPSVPLKTDVATTAESAVVSQAVATGWPGVGGQIEFDIKSGKWSWANSKWPNRETTLSAHVKLKVSEIVDKKTVKGTATIGGKLKSKKGNNPIDERTFTRTSYDYIPTSCWICAPDTIQQRNKLVVEYYFSGTYFYGWEVTISGGGASSWTWPNHPNWFGATGGVEVKGYGGIETMKINSTLVKTHQVRSSYNGGITWTEWTDGSSSVSYSSFDVPDKASNFQFNGSANGSGTVRKSTNSAGKDVWYFDLSLTMAPSIEFECNPFGIKVKSNFPLFSFSFYETWDMTEP